jgi:zinc/manganese transport system substrate-binding protein
MKSKVLLVIGLLFAFATQAKLNVVVTTPDLGSVAAEIGGDRIELTTLMRPTEDPHFVEAKPSFIAKLARADVLIEGGAELETGWLAALLQRAGNPKIATGKPGRVLANQGVKMLEIPATLDRSQGDVHASGNPHFMMDPENARIAARHFAEAFSVLDASSAEAYQSNLKKFNECIDERLPAWQKILAPCQGQSVVGYHRSWPYFARRFGLKIDVFLEPKPGLPPTPAHLAEVIGKIKEANIRLIIVDRYLDRRTADSVAQRTGAAVLEVSQYPGAIKGVEPTYVALVDYLVNSIARSLERPK